MVPLLEQVGFSISSHRLFTAAQPILVAVSGGVDSMVLLDVMARLSGEQRWKLTVAHFNHQLRGVSSDGDERLVRRRAKELDLPTVVSRANVRRLAESKRLSIEMAARKLRHDFLAAAAAERGIPSIALAHHLDDQIELFFLRLFRGSGSQGLAGMKWTNPSPSDPAISLVRPLLDCSKVTLAEYAKHQRIRFRRDSTNDCLDIQRNRIRLELLPLLQQKYQSGLDRTILRLMNIVGAESELVNALAEAWLGANLSDRKSIRLRDRGAKAGSRSAKPSQGWYKGIAHCSFDDLPIAVQRCCVKAQLVGQGVIPGYGLVEHLRLHPGQAIDVPNSNVNPSPVSLRIVRDPGGKVQESRSLISVFRGDFCHLDLRDDRGQTDWEGLGFSWQICPSKGPALPPKRAGTELFDADRVGATVVLRHWRPGDRFQPIGMERAVKLQDLFVNHKVPQARRHQLAVATTAKGELFWVEGLRISERFKLTRSTIRRLHWAWQRL